MNLQRIDVTGSRSLLSFEKTGDANWPEWDRYLTFEGKRLFHIGNICGTCPFFFERMGIVEAPDFLNRITGVLRTGVSEAKDLPLEALSRLLPNGRYLTAVHRMKPNFIEPGGEEDFFTHEGKLIWGSSHSPETTYFRDGTKRSLREESLHSFVMPLVPTHDLSLEIIAAYEKEIAAGARPTAVAISVLDLKGPIDFDENYDVIEKKHWCLAHYLLDGHHKLMAAAKLGREISLLSFLSLRESIAKEEECEEVVSLLANECAHS